MIVKPLPPLDERQAKAKTLRDFAGAGAWSITQLESMLTDMDEQPTWRDRADRACSFCDNVDNEQLTPLQKFEAMRNGVPARAINLVGRVINGVLGQEARSRRDPVLEADDDELSDVCDALNVKLKEAHRETMADMAVSNAYASQVKAGIGWVEVRRNADPFLYTYAVHDIPRNEVWWDWRAKRIDLSDARWVCRAEWKDIDEVVAAFPQHRDAIERATGGYASWFADGPVDEEVHRGFFDATGNTRFRTRTAEWLQGARRRIRIYHVQYRVPAMVVVLNVGYRKIIVDPANPLHREAIQRRLGKLEKVPTMQIRSAMYAGPFRLSDEPTRLKRFSYIPFFAFRRDSDGTPYGLVEGMIAPQEDYNESSQRVRWMLKAQQLFIDDDALNEEYNTIADITENAMKPDMVAVLKATRRNAKGIEIRNDLTLQKELVERMADSKLLIQDVPGVYGPQLGDAPTGVTSGIAMNTLVEQGIVAMGELNDNYLLGRRLVYEALFDLIVEDHTQRDLQVKVGSGTGRRVVVLNTVNPQTGEAMNVVKDAPVRVGLGEAPASPAYQMQTAQLVGNMIKALAGTPHAALLIPGWVETNSMFGPNRKQIADDMRRATGQPTEGDRQAMQAAQQQQMEQAKQQQALEAAEKKAGIAKTAADARLAQAKAAQLEVSSALDVRNQMLTESQAAMPQPATEDQLIQEALAEAGAA